MYEQMQFYYLRERIPVLYGLPWGVNKAWYIQIRQVQDPLPCMKAEQGVPL